MDSESVGSALMDTELEDDGSKSSLAVVNDLKPGTLTAVDPNTEQVGNGGVQNRWGVMGAMYRIVPKAEHIDKLPVAIYTLNVAPGFLYLERLNDKFIFPFRLYGLETTFIKRVVKTYNATSCNLGVLFNGIKGTGKTVSAQVLSNELNLPVVIINKDYGNALVDFISGIQQDVILFFDEFEKMFPNDKNSEQKLLTVMDGALKNKWRKIFLLTTNSMSIERNMVQRPGRILYIRSFGNLPAETIIEIVDDVLIHKHHRTALIKFIGRLELITVDIVLAVIREVNIHDEDPNKFAPFFNVKLLNEKMDLYEVVLHEGEVIERWVKSNIGYAHDFPWTEEMGYIGHSVDWGRGHKGRVVEIINDGFGVVTETSQTVVDDVTGQNKNIKTKRTYIFRKAYSYNPSMEHYKFNDV